MNPEITVIGFPKCGTSALMRCFENDVEMHMLRTPSRGLEISWPTIRDIRPKSDPQRIVVHKFTAYIYNQVALKYLVDVNAQNLIVLCVRDPIRALVSWHNMHREIARSGKNRDHFAWKERDFYADCSVADYYQKFAESRLQYDKHLQTALSIIPKERLVVVSQERMAKDMISVAEYLKALSRAESGISPALASTLIPEHKAYADRAKIVLPPKIQNDLQDVKHRLANIVASNVLHKCI